MAGNRNLRVAVRITADGTSAVQEVKRVETGFQRFGSSIRANALKITAAVASVGAAFQELRRASNLEAQTNALRRQLAEQGQSFDAFIGKLREVSDAQISTANLIQSSSRALLLGIPAEQIADLLEIARARAIALGTDIGQAFDDLTVGLARRSIPILDNLGFTTRDLQKAQEDFAAQLGKTTRELTAQEQSTALLQGILKQGKADVEAYANAQSQLGRGLEQTTALLGDFRTLAGQVGTVLAGGLAAIVTRAASGFVTLGAAIALVVENVAGLLSRLPLIGGFFADIDVRARQVGARLRKTNRDLQSFADRLSTAADAGLRVLLGLERVEEQAPRTQRAVRDLSDATEDLGAQAGEASGLLGDLVTALDGTGDGLREVAGDGGIAADALAAISVNAQQAAAAVDDLGRRAAVVNAQGQRTGSRLTSDPEGGLFPGISGASYTYTVARSVPTENGGVRFVRNFARGRRLI